MPCGIRDSNPVLQFGRLSCCREHLYHLVQQESEGIEPSAPDLESRMLPLHHDPIRIQISLPVYVLEHPFLVGICFEDAAPQSGVEPKLPDSKSGVLPLHHRGSAERGGVEPLPVSRPLVFKTSAQPLELHSPG